MCGIFAYINCNVSRERRHILEVLFNGLRRLEYRGYDSAGISIDADGDVASAELHGLAAPGFSPLVFREEGKIEKLVTSVYKGMFPKSKENQKGKSKLKHYRSKKGMLINRRESV